jgi:hypothetical protein
MFFISFWLPFSRIRRINVFPPRFPATFAVWLMFGCLMTSGCRPSSASSCLCHVFLLLQFALFLFILPSISLLFFFFAPLVLSHKTHSLLCHFFLTICCAQFLGSRAPNQLLPLLVTCMSVVCWRKLCSTLAARNR